MTVHYISNEDILRFAEEFPRVTVECCSDLELCRGKAEEFGYVGGFDTYTSYINGVYICYAPKTEPTHTFDDDFNVVPIVKEPTPKYPNPPHKHAELIKAWADGAEIEYFSSLHNDWKDVRDPTWEAGDYRIKPAPKPKLTKPSINWSAIDPRWKYVAKTSSGELFFTDTKPVVFVEGHVQYWLTACGTVALVRSNILSNTYLGTCDWQDSLVERPEGSVV